MSTKSTQNFTHLGEKIKFLRLSHHMSQNALAAAINCNRERIHDYESGIIQHPDLYFVENIADLYNVSLDYFRNSKGGNM